MTREEYIKQEAMRYADNPDMSVLESITAEHSFYDGAVYADQHPRKGLVDIEKVYDYIFAHSHIVNDEYEPFVVLDDCSSKTEFVDNMCKKLLYERTKQ